LKVILRGFIFFLLLTTLFAERSDAQLCATPGGDGPTNIAGSINTYFPAQPNTTLTAGANSIKLATVPVVDAHGNSFGSTPISAGDLLLVIQMQDASISFTNDTKYGANDATAGTDGLGGTGFTNIGSSGRFEYLVATNNVPLTGGTLTFKGAGTGNGTLYAYTNADANSTRGKREFQIIRIPQYSNLKLTSNVSPPPFNGNAGGVIAFSVAGNMDFNGFTIDVSGRGFRGGYSLIKVTQGVNLNDLYVAPSDDNRVSGKGEGIAGTPRYMWDGYNQVDNIIEGLPNGSGGRGAPGNAGGGGNDVNAGGGGGGNGGMGGVGGYGYEVDGGTFPNGGRPGFTNFATTPDVNRLIMGGGGGGGHANDALTGVKGGVGGGIVLISAITITGTGTILANGGDGAPGEFGGHPDGSGGGGAGGTVLVKVSTPDPTAKLTITANGGKGGYTVGDDPGTTGVQPHGPGGGGGGGQIFYAIGSGTISHNVLGGASGKTNSGAGITHNAANGAPGIANAVALGSLPISLQGSSVTCYPELVTTMSVPNPTVAVSGGDVVNYTIKITNAASGGSAGGVEANCSFPSVISFVSATAVYTGAASGPAQLTNTGTANQPVLGDFNIPFGETVTITLSAKIDCSALGTYNSNAQAVYLDPTRNYQQPNRRITAATNAFPGAITTYQTGVTGPVPGSNYNGAISTAEDVVVKNNPALANNSITAPAVTSFCGNADPSNIVGSTPTGGTGTYTYQWQSSTDNTNFTVINGATAKDYDPPAITSTTYYRRTVISGICSTPLTSNVVTISVLTTLATPVPTSETVSVCFGNTASLSVANPQAGVTYNWYDSAAKTTLLHAGPTYTTALLTANATYYIEATNGSCTNSSLASVNVTVVPLPVAPVLTVNSSQACYGSKVTLTDDDTQGGHYNWYTTPTGGTAVATGVTFVTGAITQNTTYYVENVNSTGCISATRTRYDITVVRLPTAPQVLVPAPVCYGTPAALSIINPQAGLTYNWYTASTGGTSVATGATFTTANLTANTTYYAEAVNSNSCASNRTLVTIPITPLPIAPQLTPPVPICSGASETLAVANPQTGITYNWYNSSTKTTLLHSGTTYNTGPLLTNTAYFVEATNGSCANASLASVQVNVVQLPPAPAITLNNLQTCYGTQVTYVDNTPQNGQYSWYTVPTGGTPIFTGITYVSAPLTQNTTYYVENVNSNGCVSTTRTRVDITINPAPQAPQVQAPAPVCYGTPVALNITNPQAGLTYNWYTTSAGGLPLATGSTFSTANLTANVTYYAEAANSNSCPSSRTPVNVTVIPVPTAPQIKTPVPICNGSIETLAIVNPQTGITYNWYNAATAGTLAGTGTTFNTLPLTTSTNYYVEAVSNTAGCISPTRTLAAVIVTQPPVTPVPVTPTLSVCSGSAATIAIASPQAGVAYNWYSSPAKTTLLFTGSNYTTKPITANTTYYIEAVNGPCTSPSIGTAQVNVIALPGVPAVVKNSLQTCSGTQVTLNIANPQPGITYNWYKTATGGTSVFTGPDFLTPELTGNTTYYAEAANSNSCVSATRTPVTTIVTPAPGISTQSISICPGEKGVIVATTDDKDATISWYASATSTTVLATGSSFTTPVLNNNAIYYAEAVDNTSGCISVTRSVATVTLYKQLAAPVVSVAKTTVTSVTFEWSEVPGASGYQVSIDGGKTFTNPSSGAAGLSHTVTGLTLGLRVTIIVEATGVSTCQLSGSSTAITGIAHDEKTDVIYVANAFTPNGDGVNDVVYVHSEVIKSLNFYIYDQWGELLFKTSSKDAGWDGTYKGTKQPVGVYVYYVEALMNDGQKITKKGTITLLR
jgi:gliding motility-associated-like protein